MSLLKGSDTLREMYPKVNSKFADLDAKDQELKDRLDAYKLEHEQQRQFDQLKVAKVEKELSDYKATIAGMNPNQEPKQKVNGYGIIPLPKNAANGQVSVCVRGNTISNILNNYSDINNFTTLDGTVIDDYVKLTYSQRFATFKLEKSKLKPNTLYTIKVFVRKNTLDSDFVVNSQLNSVSAFNDELRISSGSVGEFTFKCTTIPDFSAVNFALRTFVHSAATTGEIEYRVLIVEGDVLSESLNYVTGTKSTVGALRIRSVSEDGTQESSAYVIATDADTGEILELRSLPNGTKDEIRVSEGKLIKRVSNEHIITLDDFKISSTPETWNMDIWYINTLPNQNTSLTSNLGFGKFHINGMREILFNERSSATPTETEFVYYVSTDGNYLVIGYPKTLTSEEARNIIIGTKLIYQLATPIEIPIQTSGSLVSYSSGTVYIEPFVADAGIYADKMEVLHQDLPIKVLEKLSKIDFMTGIETELDVSDAVIAEDKLSFTHPDLTRGDIVFFVYEHGAEGTIPETEISYYDSRYVIRGEDDKFYQWEIEAKLVEGVITPSIKLVEV